MVKNSSLKVTLGSSPDGYSVELGLGEYEICRPLGNATVAVLDLFPDERQLMADEHELRDMNRVLGSSPYVSRSHAIVKVEERGVRIQDHGSKGGTYLYNEITEDRHRINDVFLLPGRHCIFLGALPTRISIEKIL